MPFRFSDPRTDQLIRMLREKPDGATLIQIAAWMEPCPNIRTLQRWLSKLVSVGLVSRHGSTNKLRYFAGTGRGAWAIKRRKPKRPIVRAPDPPPAPPSRPEPIEDDSQLRPEFRPVFDRAAPKIIKMGYSDDVAMGVLGQASVAAFGDDTDLTNQFILECMAELDVLNRDRTLAKYAIKPDEWDNWRPRWCYLRDLPEE